MKFTFPIIRSVLRDDPLAKAFLYVTIAVCIAAAPIAERWVKEPIESTWEIVVAILYITLAAANALKGFMSDPKKKPETNEPK